MFFFLNVCKLSPVHVILWCLRFFYIFCKKIMPNKNVSFKERLLFFHHYFCRAVKEQLGLEWDHSWAFLLPRGLSMNQNSSEFSVLSVSAAQSHSEETGRSAASKPLSARAGNDSNSGSDFQLESGRRKDRKHRSHLQRIQAPQSRLSYRTAKLLFSVHLTCYSRWKQHVNS